MPSGKDLRGGLHLSSYFSEREFLRASDLEVSLSLHDIADSLVQNTVDLG